QAPQAMRRARPAPAVQAHGAAAHALAVTPELVESYPDFASVIELITRMRDMTLLVLVERHVSLVRYSPGRIEYQPRDNPPADLAQRLAERLRGWTAGQRWAVTITNEDGAPTIAETREAQARADRDRALALPIVQQVLAAFPGATLTGITRVAPEAQVADLPEGAANPHDGTEGPVAEVEEWDPFEDED
ncbi:DNA polymerase III subunit gamma/tau, partial [Paracoccus marcusii]